MEKSFVPLISLLLLIPFQNTPLLNGNIADTQGLKIINIIALSAVVASLLRRGVTWPRDKLSVRAAILFGIYALLFVIALWRSLDNVGLFAARIPLVFPADVSSYLLSFLIKPLVLSATFLLVLHLAHDRRQIEYLFTATASSIVALSISLLWLVAGNSSVIAGGREWGMSALTEVNFGLQYNSVGTILSTGAPLILSLAKRNRLMRIGFVLAATAIAILPSRSGFIMFGIGCAIYLLFTKQFRALFMGTVTFVVIAGVVAIPSLGQLTTVGIINGNVTSLDSLLTGRLEAFWVPLLSEWWTDNWRFFLGAGRYGILTSSRMYGEAVLTAGHAHNAYIDFFLDSGIFLTILLVVALCVLLRRALRTGTELNDNLYWASIASILTYLAGTFTERSFYPIYDNFHMFAVVAYAVALARLHFYPQFRLRVPRSGNSGRR